MKAGIIKDLVDAIRDWTKGKLADITALFPSQASSSNQLADKAFVNSSVSTSTANFRGNWNTWAIVPTSGSSYPVDFSGVRTPSKNDYLVVIDASDYTSPGEEIVFERIEPRQDGKYLKVTYKGNETYFPSGGAIYYLDPEHTIGAYTTGTPTSISLKSYSAGKIIFNGVTYNENVYIMIRNDIGGMNVGDKIIAYTEGRNDKLGTWRFKYSGDWDSVGKSGWLPEYQVNEEPMTAAQVAAINSGITAELVQKLIAL